MHFGGSVVGKAPLIDPRSRPPSSNFHRGGQKVQKLASSSTSLKFELPALENIARYLNSETNLHRPMLLPSLIKLGQRIPENRSVNAPPL